jgi:pyruvate/2-oxoglutarate dehydrogenase complex dihydrolipoamide dehydrogenase (E3) component
MSNDFDLIVIGGGAGGLVSSGFAAALGLKVGLVSDGPPGGECLWTGCVPSKALIHSANVAHVLRKYGGDALATEKLSFKVAMDHMRKAREHISHHDSVETVEKSGVKVILGRARFLNSQLIDVDGKWLSAGKFIVATGGYQKIPAIDGLSEAGCLTHESILELEQQPEHLVIVGAGPVGIEYAQTMRRLGVKVTVVEADCRPLNREEPETSQFVLEKLTSEGVVFHCYHKLVRVQVARGAKLVTIDGPEGTKQINCDQIFVATGKTPTTSRLDLQNAGVKTDKRGFIEVNEHQRTSCRNIWAVGDVCGSFQFTHYADHTAQVAVLNACLGLPVKATTVVPWCTFIDPEVASVGMRRATAIETFGEERITTLDYGLKDYDRAILDDAAQGFIKVVVEGSGKILGATVVGERAGELIHEFSLAMKAGKKITDLAGLIHVYPSMSGAVRNAATGYYRATAKGSSWKSKLLKAWAQLLK